MRTACMQAEDLVSHLEGGNKQGVRTLSYGGFPIRWRTPVSRPSLAAGDHYGDCRCIRPCTPQATPPWTVPIALAGRSSTDLIRTSLYSRRVTSTTSKAGGPTKGGMSLNLTWNAPRECGGIVEDAEQA
jgi:hypothetical protein